jgi:hypothetical protein
MADIKNYTLNFGSGRALRAFDFALAKSACTEVQRGRVPSNRAVYG